MIASSSSTSAKTFMLIGHSSCKRGRNPMEIPNIIPTVCINLAERRNTESKINRECYECIFSTKFSCVSGKKE